VVTGDHVRENSPRSAELLDRVYGPEGGVVYTPWRAFQVCFVPAGRSKISLELGMRFAEVMPEACKLSPIAAPEHTGEFTRRSRNAREVLV